MRSIRSITTTLAAVGALSLVGAPAALAQNSTADYPTDRAGQTDGAAKKGKKKGKRARALSDAQLTRVATALGTTLEALKAAQAEVKTALDATEERETKAERDALLAGKLDVTVEQLRAAFAGVRGTTDGTCKRGGSSTGDYPTDSSAT